MASPKKVNDIEMAATSLSDSALPVTHFNRASLIAWLEGLSGSSVAVFFSGDGSDNGTDNHLVLADVGQDGKPVANNHFSSISLPCPPYCSR